MYKGTIALTLSLLVAITLTPAAMAQGGLPAITEAEAQAIAIDAYVYFYSLVTMDVTRRQFTNIEPGKELGKGPMNMFNNVPEYPLADFKSVVRPNFDTLYSIRLSRHDQGACGRFSPGHQRAILFVADARYVVGRVRFARLAHHRNPGAELSGDPARLAA